MNYVTLMAWLNVGMAALNLFVSPGWAIVNCLCALFCISKIEVAPKGKS